MKIFIFCIIRLFLSLLKLFPLNKKTFFFESYQGEQFSCNPRAVFEYLKNKNCNCTFIWSAKKFSNFPDDVKKVHPKTFLYYFYLITSKYVITNIELSSFIPKKKNAIWINTWHGGGAFKRVEHEEKTFYQKLTKKLVSIKTNFHISSSRKFSEVMQESTGIQKEKFISVGMPRNDVLFDNEKINLINKNFRRKFNISEEDFVVLYAPTYRGNLNSPFDINLDFEKFYKKVQVVTNRKAKFLFRAHHAMLGNFNFDNNYIIDVTNYMDIQDLLCVSDFLITDYSSIIWDYSLLKKSAALFVPDLQEYQNERGFYTPIETWPFPFYKTNEELCKNFSVNVNIQKIEQYHKSMGSYETGHSCESVFNLITEK